MNFGTIQVTPEDMLGRVETRLQAILRPDLTTERVFLSLADDDAHLVMPPGDSFVTIFPESLPVWQSVVSGGGRENTGFDAAIRTTVFVRLNTDQELRSTQVIRSASLGAVSLSTKVLGLQFWTGETTAGSGVSPLREYMRVARGPVFQPRTLKNSLWVKISTLWECKFSAALPAEVAI